MNIKFNNLSFEAKTLYLRDQIKGESTSVNLYKELDAPKKPPLEFYKKLVLSGWGINIDINQINVYYFDEHKDKKEILLENQKMIKEKKALFTFGIREKKDSIIYVISINHYLADEQTLNLFINLMKIGITFSTTEAIREAEKMNKNYRDYIKEQEKYRVITKKRECDFNPIKLSIEGPLSWNPNKERITVSKEFNSNINIEKIPYYLVEFLRNENTFCSGNTVCSSKLWSSEYSYDCLGMVTGLIPINMSEYSYDFDKKGDFSLETKAFKDKYYKKILDACLLSELFINTSVTRNLSSKYILDTSFPVGIEIDCKGENKVKIEFEGRFYSENSVRCMLDKIELNLKGA